MGNSKRNKQPVHYVIAIGASAGGLEALQDFLANLPEELDNVSIIIAQHLSPTHKSMLVQLLSRKTRFKVAEASDGHKLELNRVYITPPDKSITVHEGVMSLRKPGTNAGPKPSVDELFRSLADHSARYVIGIILSGTGSDGAAGVRHLKDAGAYIIVQEPDTSRFNGMPIAAIQTETPDAVLPPDKMGIEILEYIRNPIDIRVQREMQEEEGNTQDKIFGLLSRRTGTDFSNYKGATIGRRLQKRLSTLKIESIQAYLEYVENKPDELDEMFQTILIGVTQFFRDKEAFEALQESLKQIYKVKPVRIPSGFGSLDVQRGKRRIPLQYCCTGFYQTRVGMPISRFLLPTSTIRHFR